VFTDKEIVELHADKKYKKSNGFFRNVRLARAVIKTGVGGISISMSNAGTVSISVAIISLFWLFLRYKFITKEMTDCRSRIIEGLLNTGFVIDPDKLVKDSIGTGNMWLEFRSEKIGAVSSACVEYIETAEHRAILSAHSYITDSNTRSQAFQKVLIEIKRVFKLANDELVQIEIKEAMLKYSNVLNNNECVTMLQNVFSNNLHAGKLTHRNDSNNGNEGGNLSDS